MAESFGGWATAPQNDGVRPFGGQGIAPTMGGKKTFLQFSKKLSFKPT
jgi:hypothetical protein